MNRVRIALFKDWAAAKPIHERLLQAGIAAEIHDEIWLARLWFVSKLSAGIRVEVPACRSKRAVQLVLTWDAAEGALRGAIHCPECNSLRVDYPQFTRKSFVTTIIPGNRFSGAELFAVSSQPWAAELNLPVEMSDIRFTF